MTTPNPPFKVIIVGSGLAGSLLANGLIHNNIEVSVYERLERHAEREGYQIRLGAEALRGFRACLDTQQIQDIVQKFGRSGGVRSVAPVVYDKQFRQLLDLTQVPDYSKSAPINRGILRDLLADPVFEAGKLQYGRAFTRYEILDPGKPAERVRVWFSDGSTDECNILIGADGSHSKVNTQLGLNNISSITSHMAMIAKHEIPASLRQKLDPRAREKPVMAFSDQKSFWFNVYLPDKDEDESQSSMMFGVCVPVEQCPEDLMEKSMTEKWSFVSSALRDWSTEYQDIINLIKDSNLYVFKARASTRPSRDWRTKVKSNEVAERGHARVWLLGDAIHAMLPNRGMGANQAMADTATLLPLLSKLGSSAAGGATITTDEIEKNCQIYEDEMIPRAFEWVKKSGGLTMVPVDPSRVKWRLFFVLANIGIKIASLWFRFTGLFITRNHPDAAPELRD